MARKSGGGRSTDDERPDDEPIDELAEEDLDEDDLDPDDEAEEDGYDEEPVPSRAGGRATASKVATGRARAVPRSTRRDASRPGLIGRFVNFVREVVAELQKVIWPTRKELLTYTTVVVVFVAIVMTFVAGLDYGFARLMFFVFGNKTTN